MSMEERTGHRDLTYSGWHRPSSIHRYTGYSWAQQLGMIDIDDVEYCRKCNQPLALIETALDTGQAHKTGTVTANLAIAAGIPAYAVLYRKTEDQDIDQFRLRRLTPQPDPAWRTLTPAEYAQCLVTLRTAHKCYSRLEVAA